MGSRSSMAPFAMNVCVAGMRVFVTNARSAATAPWPATSRRITPLPTIRIGRVAPLIASAAAWIASSCAAA